jgi:hypothetical protein
MGGFFAKLLQKTDRLNTLFRVFFNCFGTKHQEKEAVKKVRNVTLSLKHSGDILNGNDKVFHTE